MKLTLVRHEKLKEKVIDRALTPYYTLRMMPCIYLIYDLPGNLFVEKEAA